MTDLIDIRVLCKDAEEAELIATSLLDDRLIACANVGQPVTSHYVWQGQRDVATEIPVDLKTTRARYSEAEYRIKALHSYDVPCIIATEIVAASVEYIAWLKAAVEPNNCLAPGSAASRPVLPSARSDTPDATPR